MNECGRMSRYPVCKYEILRIAKQFKELFYYKTTVDYLSRRPNSKLYYRDDGFSITLKTYNPVDDILTKAVIEEYKSRFPRVEVKQYKERNLDLSCESFVFFIELRVYYKDVEDYVQEKIKGVWKNDKTKMELKTDLKHVLKVMENMENKWAWINNYWKKTL